MMEQRPSFCNRIRRGPPGVGAPIVG